jgi:hypothetical protein
MHIRALHQGIEYGVKPVSSAVWEWSFVPPIGPRQAGKVIGGGLMGRNDRETRHRSVDTGDWWRRHLAIRTGVRNASLKLGWIALV